MSTAVTPTSTLLRRALQGNAAFSSVCGLLFILAAKPIAAFLGTVPPVLVLITGVSLLGFAAGLARNSLRDRISLTEAKIAVAMDLMWVGGSAVAALFANALGLTRPGTWAVVIVADVVLLFAVLQFLGVRRHRNAEPGRV